MVESHTVKNRIRECCNICFAMAKNERKQPERNKMESTGNNNDNNVTMYRIVLEMCEETYER